jgi:hypothetical protein
MPDRPFNPLDKRNLAKSLAEAMLARPVGPLPPKELFSGAGIYAIYYFGPFEPYQPLARQNRDQHPSSPLYIGRAVPAGYRKGGLGLGANPGSALRKRLEQHAKSIEETNNLAVKDFSCRYLVCDDIWIPLGESLLIQEFRPVWNVLIEGFGIHSPGAGRGQQVQSKWDTLHPGRKLARNRPINKMPREKIIQLVSDFFAGKKVPVMTPKQAIVEEGEEMEEG